MLTDGLADPTSVAVSPNNKHVYVTSESGNPVSLFTRGEPDDAVFICVATKRLFSAPRQFHLKNIQLILLIWTASAILLVNDIFQFPTVFMVCQNYDFWY